MAGVQWPRGLNKSCILLIVISGIERFAFKGVLSNLVTFLTDIVNMNNSSAAKMVNIWCGLTSILPLVLAPMADSYWDRYSTIKVFSFIYVMGLVALTTSALGMAWSSASLTSSSSFLFWSLCLISLGQAGYNPSLQAFGADQLGDEEELPCSTNEKKSNRKTLFFQWWYFGICSGSLLGVTVMSYIQDTYGWVLGYAIPASSMVMSIAIFSCGSRIFKFKEDEVVNIKVFRNIKQAIKSTASRVTKGKITFRSEKPDLVELELQEEPLCQGNFDSVEGLNNNTRRDMCMPEGAKVVLRLVPIWAMLLMFAVMFQQPATFFTKQGMTMKRNIGSNFKIPPATLQSAITLSIILLMPFYDKIFIPIAQRITRNEKGITVLQRIGIGMVLSIIGLVIAAFVESKRLKLSQSMYKLGTTSDTVPLSIFLLLPQYILLGISDIFTVVGMQEFFYSEVPVKMRTMGLALYTSVFGVGSFVSALLISLIELITTSKGQQNWFSDDMREARLDKYYWLLAILSTLSLFLYVILCKFHKSRTDEEDT